MLLVNNCAFCMKTLVFDTSVTGHHLEYIHHLYLGMLKRTKEHYIFVIPESFKDNRNQYLWPQTDHIIFDFLSSEEIAKMTQKNFILSAWNRSILVREKVKKHNVDSVFLIMLMAFMPFVLFMLPGKVKLSGIIYRIYLYEWRQMNFFKKAKDVIIFLLLSHSKHVKSAFILNDSSAAAYLNKLYKTKCFKFLNDPFNKIEYTPKNIREELGIKDAQKMFLHFGGLSRRKGTLAILDSISFLSAEECKKYVFVFAGRLYPDIKEEFYKRLSQINQKCKIIIFDSFCSNETLYDLCYSCDALLIPYSNISQSSGVLNYADHFQKPLIGTGKGMLGKLIRRRKGYLLESNDAKTLSFSYSCFCPLLVKRRSYSLSDDFISKIFDNIY